MIFIWLILAVVFIFGLTAFFGAPYVPSHRSAIKKAFTELRPVGEGDLLVDIGSGDGSVLIECAKRGGRAIGYEINPILVLVSRLRSRRYKKLIQTKQANFWRAKFPSETTIVYTFGDSRDIEKMYQKVQTEADRLGKSLDFLSYGFKVTTIEPAGAKHGFYLYRINPLQSSSPQI